MAREGATGGRRGVFAGFEAALAAGFLAARWRPTRCCASAPSSPLGGSPSPMRHTAGPAASPLTHAVKSPPGLAGVTRTADAVTALLHETAAPRWADRTRCRQFAGHGRSQAAAPLARGPVPSFPRVEAGPGPRRAAKIASSNARTRHVCGLASSSPVQASPAAGQALSCPKKNPARREPRRTSCPMPMRHASGGDPLPLVRRLGGPDALPLRAAPARRVRLAGRRALGSRPFLS